jgi:hypothetical protein
MQEQVSRNFMCREAVFRIHDILVWIWIRIRGSMPLTNGSGSGFGFGSGSGCGSGSCFFVIDLQDANKKLNLKRSFSAYYFLKVHLHHFSKIKRPKEVTQE